eukprot:6510643-Prymnesium_polylepis.1
MDMDMGMGMGMGMGMDMDHIAGDTCACFSLCTYRSPVNLNLLSLAPVGIPRSGNPRNVSSRRQCADCAGCCPLEVEDEPWEPPFTPTVLLPPYPPLHTPVPLGPTGPTAVHAVPAGPSRPQPVPAGPSRSQP